LFDWVTSFVEGWGYLGIALLMLAENVFPPIPSEVVMPLAGFTAAEGDLNLFLVMLAGSVGSLAGAFFWYYVGKLVGCDGLKRFTRRHGRWLTLSTKEIDKADRWFDRHGGKAVLVGRLVPAVRTLISVPAGIAEMPRRTFLLYSAVGTVAWTAFLAVCGFLLESRYDAVAAYVNPVSNVVVGIMVAWYLYRVVTWRREDAPRT